MNLGGEARGGCLAENFDKLRTKWKQVGAIVESQQSHRESERSWICCDQVLESIATGDSIGETLSMGRNSGTWKEYM